jgi:hypothetical protein
VRFLFSFSFFAICARKTGIMSANNLATKLTHVVIYGAFRERK